MIVTLIGAFTVSINATAEPMIYSENVSGQAGDNVTLKIYISDNPGIASLQLAIGYDKNALNIVSTGSVTNGSATAGIMLYTGSTLTNYQSGFFKISWFSAGNCTSDGILLQISFKITDFTPPGSYPVSVSYVQAQTKDEENNNVVFQTSSGNITVNCSQHTVGDWETTTAASCTAGGVKVKKCTICGEILSSEAIALLGHSYGEWESAVLPTLLDDGQEKRTCSTCHEEDIHIIPSLILGDVDSDRVVSATDLVLVKKSLLNLYTLTDQQRLTADMDANSKIEIVDLVAMKKMIVSATE